MPITAFLSSSLIMISSIVIVGIASDYKEAVQIVLKITNECVSENGNCNLKEYLKQKAKITE